MDHAGLMLLLPLFQTESRLLEKQDGQISTLLLRFSSPAVKMMVAMVVKLITLMNGFSRITLPMKPAQSTEQEDMTMVQNAQALLNVRTVTILRADALLQIDTMFIMLTNMARSKVKKP